MASDDKKTKAETAPKAEGAPKAEVAPKTDAAAKVKSPAAGEARKDAPDDAPKSAGGEAGAPATYSRGEGQKPVTAAYKENWNAIFGKKRTKKKKR